ncbi:MAG TPA: S41 family peptidase [Gemmataceae bacterium]
MSRRFAVLTTAAALLAAAAARAQIRIDSDEPLPLKEGVPAEVVGALIKELKEGYVFPEAAEKMAEAVGAKLKAGDYDGLATGQELARRLTADLQEISKDRHLRVRCSTEPLPERLGGKEPTPEMVKRMQRQARWRNAGFVKVERLPGNVGYLELRGFMDPEAGGEPLAAAMNFLANTDALIIDLRRNGGGTPLMVRLVCSYLFDEKPVHLNSLYFRKDDRTEEFWTLKEVPGKRYLGKDVYVLTSRLTFSGAEECAYNLKCLKRATIVGETTGGGAHPGGAVRLTDHFLAFIPTGRAINPITKTNWEGTGVEPDVKVDADAALEKAHELALAKLRAAAKGEAKEWLEMDVEMEKRLEERYRERNKAKE